MTDSSSGAKKWQELIAQTKREQVAPGDLVAGRFRVEEHLGTGGMGVVLSAFDLEDNQEVALKILRMADVDETGMQRFIREARTSMRIQSPYVVQVLDTGMDQGRPFIVMERLQGTDLSERLRRHGPVSLWETADILLMACEALANAHGAGIVHRDIKLSNLFMATDPRGGAVVKVLDFGISKARARGEYTLTESHDGSLLGSPPYMAPEQIRNAKTVDHRADIWSLGVVAYRLLSGEHPYHGDTVGEVFASILERRFRTLASRGLKVPPEVEAIISTCMQVDLTMRYQNVGALATALHPFASAYGQKLVQRIVDISRQVPPPIVQVAQAPKPDRSTATVTHSVTGESEEGGQPTVADPAEVADLHPPATDSTGGSRGSGINVVRSLEDDAPFEPWFKRAGGRGLALGVGTVIGLGVVLAALNSSSDSTVPERSTRERSQASFPISRPVREKLQGQQQEEPQRPARPGMRAPVTTANAAHPGKPSLQDNPYEKP
jgi:eukaryotic-like serine/threonine-protein kinase